MAVTAVSTTKQTFQPQTAAASSGDSGFAQLLESRIAGLSGNGNQGSSDPLLAALAQPVATQPRTAPSGTAQAQSATTTATPAKIARSDSGSQTDQTQTAGQTGRDTTAPHAGVGEDDRDDASRPVNKDGAANQSASESETTAQDNAAIANTGDAVAPAYVQAQMTPANPAPKPEQAAATPAAAKPVTEAVPEAAAQAAASQTAASQAAVEAPETAPGAPSAPAADTAQTSQAAAAQSAELAKTAKDTKVSVKVEPAKPEQEPAAASTTELAPEAAVAAQSEAQARSEGENAEPEAPPPAPADTSAADAADATALQAGMAFQALAGQGLAQAAGQGGAAAGGGNAVSGVSGVQSVAAAATGLGEARAMREGGTAGQVATTRQTALPNTLDQIKVQVGKGLAEGKDTISVRLNPDNMGRVDIKLELQEGRVRAVVTADRPETLQLLKSDSTNLVQALQDAGLETDSSQLSFQLRGEGQEARQFAGQREQGGSSGGKESTPEIAAEPVPLAASSSDGLDISV